MVEDIGIDPELVDDRDIPHESDDFVVDLPDYDGSQFELGDDVEFEDEEVDDNGGQDED